jgi:hypothetical protein
LCSRGFSLPHRRTRAFVRFMVARRVEPSPRRRVEGS